MDIKEIKELELLECTACSGSGCYCGGKCGACNGTGIEYDSDYILTLKENLIHEQLNIIESLKCCGNCGLNERDEDLITIKCKACSNRLNWQPIK